MSIGRAGIAHRLCGESRPRLGDDVGKPLHSP
jgi:hypothetical protein